MSLSEFPSRHFSRTGRVHVRSEVGLTKGPGARGRRERDYKYKTGTRHIGVFTPSCSVDTL